MNQKVVVVLLCLLAAHAYASQGDGAWNALESMLGAGPVKSPYASTFVPNHIDAAVGPDSASLDSKVGSVMDMLVGYASDEVQDPREQQIINPDINVGKHTSSSSPPMETDAVQDTDAIVGLLATATGEEAELMYKSEHRSHKHGHVASISGLHSKHGVASGTVHGHHTSSHTHSKHHHTHHASHPFSSHPHGHIHSYAPHGASVHETEPLTTSGDDSLMEAIQLTESSPVKRPAHLRDAIVRKVRPVHHKRHETEPTPGVDEFGIKKNCEWIQLDFTQNSDMCAMCMTVADAYFGHDDICVCYKNIPGNPMHDKCVSLMSQFQKDATHIREMSIERSWNDYFKSFGLCQSYGHCPGA